MLIGTGRCGWSAAISGSQVPQVALVSPEDQVTIKALIDLNNENMGYKQMEDIVFYHKRC